MELSKIFLDKDGYFQWASLSIVTSVITLIGVFIVAWVNIANNKKTLRMTVVSNARIRWVEDERKLIAEFLTLMYKFNDYIQLYNKDSKELDYKSELDYKAELDYKISEIRYRIDEVKNLIRLSFPKNTENDTFLLLFEDAFKGLDNIYNGDGEAIKFETSLERIIEESRKYFKNEWSKASSLKEI